MPFITINCPTGAENTMSPTHVSALSFFSGVVAWYDILSCATTGSQPFSVYNCLVSEVGYIKLEKLMGCENWVMVCVMEIARLRHWKQEMQMSDQLSLRELASRAEIIEKKLEDGVKRIYESLDEMRMKGKDLTNKGRSVLGSKYLAHVVTRMFALTALVYLHVTVSGPYPEIAEIQNCVSRTITAFRALPQSDLVRNLSWPMYIVGCMATGEHQNAFRDIAASIGLEKHSFGTSSQVLEVMEECWRLRADGIVGADWTTAMKSLNLNVLLV